MIPAARRRPPVLPAPYRMGAAMLGGVAVLTALTLFALVFLPVAAATGRHGPAAVAGWALAGLALCLGGAILWSALGRLAVSLAAGAGDGAVVLAWHGLLRRGTVTLGAMYRIERWTRFALVVTFPGPPGSRDRRLTLLREPALQTFLGTLAASLGGLDPFTT